MSRLQEEIIQINPRLFECSNKTGTFIADEISNFNQDDLNEGDVMLLDAWDQVRTSIHIFPECYSFEINATILCICQVFLWIGKGANETEKKEAVFTAQDYLKTHPAGRDPDTPIIVVKQGFEPPTFTGWFHAWDPHMWSVGLALNNI